MGRLRFVPKRDPKEWAVRSALALSAVWLCYLAVTQSLAMALQSSQLDRAHMMAPNNGFITGLWSRSLSGPEATPADRNRSDSIAKLALLQDPTSVEAVATLGLNAQIKWDTAAARRDFAYSQLLSRRDFQTQIWAIQDAGVRGDIPAALKHYDIALRVSPEGPNLYPALAYAIIDPAVRQELVKTLAGQPSWAQGFIDYVGANGRDPLATASFFQSLRRAGVPVSDGATAGVVNALVSAKMIDQAWSYYESARRVASREMLRNSDFSVELDAPSVFDWVPMNDGSISSSIQRSGKGGVFTFAAPPSIGGVVLQQLQLLQPGDYVLAGRSSDIDQSDDSMPYWSLSCQNGHELGRINVPNSNTANGRFAGTFMVPSDCPVQLLNLNIRPSSSISGVSGQIDQVVLRRRR